MSKNISKDFGSVDLLKGTRLILNSATAKGAFISGDDTNAIIGLGGANQAKVRLIGRNGKSGLGGATVRISVTSSVNVSSFAVVDGAIYGGVVSTTSGQVTALPNSTTGALDVTITLAAPGDAKILIESGNEYVQADVLVI